MNSAFFENNRRALQSKVNSSLIVIAGNDEVHRKADAAFNFVQDANFYYVTGIKEAGWTLLIVDGKDILVSPNRSDIQTLFDGSISLETVTATSGVKTIISRSEYISKLADFSTQHQSVGTIASDPHQKYYGFSPNTGPEKSRKKLIKLFENIEDIRPILAKLRSIKQPEEVEKMKQAAMISAAAFESVKEKIHDFKKENEIAAQLHYDFYRKSAGGHAYDPIVAGGKNACTLHYVANDQTLPTNGLVLIDAGVQYEEYAADITRTYATGTPTDRQREVHAIVEQAHIAIIDLIKPGVSLKEYSDQSDVIMKEAVQSLGLYKTEADVRKYFPHAVSHGLGIDVHESLGGYKDFQPGMVLTVEPGIYIPEEGIGVRIEDDILVTSNGNENLTASLSTSL